MSIVGVVTKLVAMGTKIGVDVVLIHTIVVYVRRTEDVFIPLR